MEIRFEAVDRYEIFTFDEFKSMRLLKGTLEIILKALLMRHYCAVEHRIFDSTCFLVAIFDDEL